jgi:hypothetical protein
LEWPLEARSAAWAASTLELRDAPRRFAPANQNKSTPCDRLLFWLAGEARASRRVAQIATRLQHVVRQRTPPNSTDSAPEKLRRATATTIVDAMSTTLGTRARV